MRNLYCLFFLLLLSACAPSVPRCKVNERGMIDLSSSGCVGDVLMPGIQGAAPVPWKPQ